MLIAFISLLPVMVTVTRPAPAVPVTSMAAISSCMASILACSSFACFIMPMRSPIAIVSILLFGRVIGRQRRAFVGRRPGFIRAHAHIDDLGAGETLHDRGDHRVGARVADEARLRASRRASAMVGSPPSRATAIIQRSPVHSSSFFDSAPAKPGGASSVSAISMRPRSKRTRRTAVSSACFSFRSRFVAGKRDDVGEGIEAGRRRRGSPRRTAAACGAARA